MIAEYKGTKYRLVGKNIILDSIRKEHLPLFVHWFNDLEVNRHLAQDYSGLTIEKEIAWLNQHKKTKNDVNFGIFYNGRIIGSASLKNINEKNMIAEYGIVIGDKNYWNKGIGTEATKLMISFGFRDLKLHSIHLFADSLNLAGIRAYEKAGFKKQGRLRDEMRHANKYSDSIVMDILEDEWQDDA